VWDAIATAGPQVSFVHDETDVDSYLNVAETFMDTVFLAQGS
jgi:glutamate-1-semialdehyde 2,1-aminomutase